MLGLRAKHVLFLQDRVESKPKYMKQSNARTAGQGAKAADGRRYKAVYLKAKKAAVLRLRDT